MYTLEAVIGTATLLRPGTATLAHTRLVPLRQELGLIPCTAARGAQAGDAIDEFAALGL